MPRPVEDRQTQPRDRGPASTRVSRRNFVLGAAAGLSALAVTTTWPSRAAGAVADGGARVIAENRLTPTMLDLTVASPARPDGGQ